MLGDGYGVDSGRNTLALLLHPLMTVRAQDLGTIAGDKFRSLASRALSPLIL
jgi:hypothetical protein